MGDFVLARLSLAFSNKFAGEPEEIGGGKQDYVGGQYEGIAPIKTVDSDIGDWP